MSADLPVLLWGEPGIGKTAALNQLADALDLPLTTVIASVHEPSDFSGLPVVGDDPATQGVPMAPPDWAVRLARAGRGSVVPGRAVHRATRRAGRAAAAGAGTPRRCPAAAAGGADRGGREPALVHGRRLGAEPAAGQPVRPSTVDIRPRCRGTRARRNLADGDAADGSTPNGCSDAVAFARRAVCTLLGARPELVHQLPKNETRRGGPWPSPRSWEMTLRLIAFATAADTSREVLSMLVRGTVGDGPGLELLASLDRMDLPDPETLLADPAAAVLPERGDLRQIVLDGVVEAVRRRPDQSRWDAAWSLLVLALDTGAPDLVVVPAATLAAQRRDDWQVPAAIERLAGAVALSRRADEAKDRVMSR